MIKAADHQLGDRPAGGSCSRGGLGLATSSRRLDRRDPRWTQKTHVGYDDRRRAPRDGSTRRRRCRADAAAGRCRSRAAAARARTGGRPRVLAGSVVGLAIHPFVLAIIIRDFFAQATPRLRLRLLPSDTHESGRAGRARGLGGAPRGAVVRLRVVLPAAVPADGARGGCSRRTPSRTSRLPEPKGRRSCASCATTPCATRWDRCCRCSRSTRAPP